MDFDFQIVKYICFSSEYDGIIRFSYQCLILPLSEKNLEPWHTKIGWSHFVDRPFFNRKYQVNEYLEPFPYKLWYDDNLSCMLHWLFVKFTSLRYFRSCDFSLTSFGKNHSFWLTLVRSIWQIDNQHSIHDKLYE